MTTDTALGVTKLVVEDKGTPSWLKPLFCPNRHLSPVMRNTVQGEGNLINTVCTCTNGPQDYPTIVFNSKESVEMPFSMIPVDNPGQDLTICRVHCRRRRATIAPGYARTPPRGSQQEFRFLVGTDERQQMKARAVNSVPQRCTQ